MDSLLSMFYALEKMKKKLGDPSEILLRFSHEGDYAIRLMLYDEAISQYISSEFTIRKIQMNPGYSEYFNAKFEEAIERIKNVRQEHGK